MASSLCPKTAQINETLYHIGQVAGGEGDTRLPTHLKMKASGTTLIRLIRSEISPKKKFVRRKF